MKYITAAITFSMLSTAAFAATPAPATNTPHESYFDKVDTNHDGVITKEEWRAYGDKLFDAIDLNHDGKITKEEMDAHYKAEHAEWAAKHAAFLAQHPPAPAAK